MMSSEALLQTRLAKFDVLFLSQRIAGTAQNKYIMPEVNTHGLAKQQPLYFRVEGTTPSGHWPRVRWFLGSWRCHRTTQP